MLKLEDFKIKEIETLETITGGGTHSIGGTATGIQFLGWFIETGSKLDSCSSCDADPAPNPF